MYGFADMHCDTLACIREAEKEGKKIELRKRIGHIDLERLKEAGYALQTFGCFVHLKSETDPTEACLEMIDIFYREMEKNKDLIRPVTTVAQMIKNKEEGILSALLSIEEGGTCKGNLAILRNFYRLGVRMMTLTWNYENEIGYPNKVKGTGWTCFGTPEEELGIKEKGVLFLEEMERLGMLIDVSHLSDRGFYDVYTHTKKPFIASHSNARTLCGHVRNLTDDMIRKLAERGGVTGLNFCADFVRNNESGKEAPATIEQTARQARYLADIGGVGCVALGSDFDGIGNDLELDSCAKMPLLAEALKKQGFTASEIDAICHENLFRVCKEVFGA